MVIEDSSQGFLSGAEPTVIHTAKLSLDASLMQYKCNRMHVWGLVEFKHTRVKPYSLLMTELKYNGMGLLLLQILKITYSLLLTCVFT